MELELKKLHDTVTSIHDEMFYLRERQGRHFHSLKHLNENKGFFGNYFQNCKLFWKIVYNVL